LSGALAALETVAIVLTLGLLAFAPLGAAASMGIAASFAAVIAGGLVYAMLGSAASPSAGPSSATSLILAGLVAQLVRDPLFHLETVQGLATLLAVVASSVVLMGLFQMLLGLSGLGRMARFVPQPVLAGFMNPVVANSDLDGFAARERLEQPVGAGTVAADDALGRARHSGNGLADPLDMATRARHATGSDGRLRSCGRVVAALSGFVLRASSGSAASGAGMA
jgi:hypothetical protein